MDSSGESLKRGKVVARKRKPWEPEVGTTALRKGVCMGDREGTFWPDKENQERLMSSEVTRVKLGGSVRMPDGVCVS